MTAESARKDGPSVAFWLETPSQAACEIGALVGYQLMLLDMEHGVLSVEAADRLIPHGKGLGLTVYSRVAAPERVPIQYALDSGADGVIVPQIRNAQHAREATAFAKYPPLGTRGIGFSRTMDYGETPPDFVDTENRRTKCYAMIETPGALAEVEAIVALDTVDGLFMGPFDLSLTRGRGPFQSTPEDEADARRIGEAAAAAGKHWGMPVGDLEAFKFSADLGAEFVSVADDLSALRAGFAQALADATSG